MAVQHAGKSPEAERYPYRERGSSVLHQRRIPIPRDPTLQIGPNFRHFLKRCRLHLADLAVLDQGGQDCFRCPKKTLAAAGARGNRCVRPRFRTQTGNRRHEASATTADRTARATQNRHEQRAPAGALRRDLFYWGASNFWRPESGPLSANVTVNGDRKLKVSTVSEGSRIC